MDCYQKELDFLSSLEFFGIKLGLEQTAELFRRMGNPEKKLKFVHVAGSNGKGSVCALMEGAFRKAGLRTGFYSSPHLVSVCERFRINGEPVSEEQLARAIRKLIPAAEAMKQDGMKITYFEATTVLAAVLFADAETDIVLWETGMGGRLDATSIVTPLAAVITGISLEHQQYLGDTVEKIAFEKAGIIKKNIPLFCSRHIVSGAMNVIRERAAGLHAPFFTAPETDETSLRITHSPGSRDFFQSFRTENGEELTIRLGGPHQRRNAALASAAVRYLSPALGLNAETALSAFADVKWDARFQFIPEAGLIIDGGHNPEGLGVLAETLKELFPGKKFHFLFGAFSDKETLSSLSGLAPLAEQFTFLEMETVRASRSIEELGRQLKSCAPDVKWDSLPLETALKLEKDNKVLCGSLHLCGNALAILKKRCIV